MAYEPKIELKVVADDPKKVGGGCYANYEVNVSIDDAPVGSVGGWVVCGWLKPGAHMDLDGSGLLLWGSSQPGGWRTRSSDGAYSGTPKLLADLEALQYDEAIVISGGEGMHDLCLTSHDIEVWRSYEIAAADAAARGSADSMELAAEAAEVRNAIISALEKELDALDIPCPKEPSSREIFEYLPHSNVEGIRYGDYCGAGPVLAARYTNGLEQSYTHWYHPDREDVEAAVGKVKEGLIAAVIENLMSELEALNND